MYLYIFGALGYFSLAGLYGAKYWEGEGSLNDLFIAGPFWANIDRPESFYVPTPLNFRVKQNTENDRHEIVERWQWNNDRGWHLESKTKEKKSLNNSWVSIEHWSQLQADRIDPKSPVPVIPSSQVWKHHPHLHPRLEDDERHVVRPIDHSADDDLPSQQGSLFLENGVQLDPDCCLVYLSSRKLEPGCYRFGGEGHLADIECVEISADSQISKLMQQPIDSCFSLLTPAVWGTQRLSYRFPVPAGKEPTQAPSYPLPTNIQSTSNHGVESFWSIAALMTERSIPFRFRMGGSGKTKRLSRGRYAVPAGTVYHVNQQISPWQDWQKEWFPKEGYSYQHWGCGFALPLTLPT